MRILCQAAQSVRNERGNHATRKPAKASVNLFEKDGAGYLVVHTEKSKGKGEKFALKANLNRCLAKFVHEGKLTIEFKEPSVNIMISKADPGQLKKLLSAIKTSFEGKTLVGVGVLTSATNKPVKIGKTTKINILSRDDYKTKLSKKSGIPAELEEFRCHGIGMKQIDMRLFKLRHLSVLDMTRNNLTTLNPKLFQLRLKALILSDNKLDERAFSKLKSSPIAESLQKLDLSVNKLHSLPSLCHFLKLSSLIIDKNIITRLPTRLPSTLTSLSARENKICFTEFPRFHKFINLNLSDNPFSMLHKFKVDTSKIPVSRTLAQVAAAKILKHKLQINPRKVPPTLNNLLESIRFCPCGEPLSDRKRMFLSGYDVRKYTSDKDTVAPMANNFVIPQIEFCCSNECFVKFSSTLQFEEDPPEPNSEDGMVVD
ncbi:unnamed protein product [Oikopleura dioica]|uniref:PIF1/LRR1 pleckstrin homology domain-containing protein n=1 Tax=Oikopleura dioica TaxID=34765 RepID=E4YC68_OIKDI|nr:unnamed protein product [Oikopleura dioica]